MNDQQTFLQELQAQAAKQAQLHQKRLLPSQLDEVTALIGNHPWQVILGLSLVTAVILRVIGT